jgi:HEPN domain-containing protein
MENETLLDIAKVNFRLALKTYKYSTGDERELNYVGYFLQQATELCIKHVLEINGIKYPGTHSIDDLLDLGQGIVKYSDEFYNFSPAITKWESKSRYIKNYLLADKQVQNGFALIKGFLLIMVVLKMNWSCLKS